MLLLTKKMKISALLFASFIRRPTKACENDTKQELFPTIAGCRVQHPKNTLKKTLLKNVLKTKASKMFNVCQNATNTTV